MLLFISRTDRLPVARRYISKHLMLLFIYIIQLFHCIFFLISKHLMLLFIFRSFGSATCLIAFQNISCYCLSIAEALSELTFVIFQNISCYCLSGTEILFFCWGKISKHLMLLFIHPGSRNCQDCIRISKHLMLLFITKALSDLACA